METSEPLCPLCQRPLGVTRIEEHHLVPKTFKGKETISLHKICHRAIHATFSERELQKYYFTINRLLESEELQRFIAWVAKKQPDFYISMDETSSRRSKRRR
jgi:hypothetical protein